MYNKKKDDLFELIHSMNKGEKWRFKMYSKRHFNSPGSDYLDLFDAIDKQSTHNEEKVKKKFGKRYSWLKNHLYNLILDSMEAYTIESYPEKKAERYLRQAEILHLRGLKPQAKKILKRAEKLVKKHELLLLHLKLKEWEQRMVLAEIQTKQTKLEIERIKNEEKELVDRYTRARDMSWLFADVFSEINNPHKTAYHPENYPSLYGFDDLLEESYTDSPLSRSKYYSVQIFLSESKNELSDAVTYNRKIVDLMEDHVNELSANPLLFCKQYVTTVYHYLLLSADIMQIADDYLDKVKNMERIPKALLGKDGLPKDLKAMVEVFTCAANLSYYLHSAKFTEGKPYAQKVSKLLSENKLQFATYDSTEPYLSLAKFYFGSGDYSEALTPINYILNKASTPKKSMIYLHSKLKRLVCHYELGNEAVLESELKSVSRMLADYPKDHSVDHQVVQYIKHQLEGTEHTSTLMYEDMITDYENQADFLLVAWLWSKSVNKEISGIIQTSTLQ